MGPLAYFPLAAALALALVAGGAALAVGAARAGPGGALPVGVDRTSAQQATGDRSDCVLQPVFQCPDPIRGGDDKLVLCEVMLVSGDPHPSNTRRANAEMAKRFGSFDTWFGIEQEYTFFEGARPLGFPESGGFPAPQGGYYCGVGADEVF